MEQLTAAAQRVRPEARSGWADAPVVALLTAIPFRGEPIDASSPETRSARGPADWAERVDALRIKWSSAPTCISPPSYTALPLHKMDGRPRPELNGLNAGPVSSQYGVCISASLHGPMALLSQRLVRSISGPPLDTVRVKLQPAQASSLQQTVQAATPLSESRSNKPTISPPPLVTALIPLHWNASLPGMPIALRPPPGLTRPGHPRSRPGPGPVS